MTILLAMPSVVYAFEKSDLMSRLVIFLLFGSSTLAWSILIEKWLYMKQLQRQTTDFLTAFRKHSGPLQILQTHTALEGPLKAVTASSLLSLSKTYQMSEPQLLAEFRANRIPRFLADGELDCVNAAMSSSVDDQIVLMEARLGLLSTIVSSSPFLGLLGTVWGVMVTFVGMAQAGRINIEAIAPGISGALLTTVIGLLVALPALFGYNLMTARVRILTVSLDNYQESLISQIRSHFQAAREKGPDAA